MVVVVGRNRFGKGMADRRGGGVRGWDGRVTEGDKKE